MQGGEAQSGRVDTGARRREVRKAEVSEVGPAALGLASHVMPVISELVTLQPGKRQHPLSTRERKPVLPATV